jgi:hypothetical protein
MILITFALNGTCSFDQVQNSEPTPVLPATINHDCAPWDGSAFTVSIPVEEGNINISIYQSPEIKHPVTFSFTTFSFHEGTEKIGHSLFLPVTGSPEPLTGKVFFERVEEGTTVEGEYHFSTENGKQFLGKFKAEWESEIVYCG